MQRLLLAHSISCIPALPRTHVVESMQAMPDVHDARDDSDAPEHQFFGEGGPIDRLTERAHWIMIALAPALAALGFYHAYHQAMFIQRRDGAAGFVLFFVLFSIGLFFIPFGLYLYFAFKRLPPRSLWLRVLILADGTVFAALAMAVEGRFDLSFLYWDGLLNMASLSTGYALFAGSRKFREDETEWDTFYSQTGLFTMLVAPVVTLMLGLFASPVQGVVLLVGFGLGTWLCYTGFRNGKLHAPESSDFLLHRTGAVIAILLAAFVQLILFFGVE